MLWGVNLKKYASCEDEIKRKGFVLVPSFFTMEEMQSAVEAVEECVDILANRLYLAGKGRMEEGDGWIGGWEGEKEGE